MNKNELLEIRNKARKDCIMLNRTIMELCGRCAAAVFDALLWKNINVVDKTYDGWFFIRLAEIRQHTGYKNTQIKDAIIKLVDENYIDHRKENGYCGYFKIINTNWDKENKRTNLAEKRYPSRKTTPPQSENVGNGATHHYNNTVNNTDYYMYSEATNTKTTQNENCETSQSAALPQGGRKSMRKTCPGQKRSDLQANSGRAATGKISTPPRQRPNLLDEFTQDEIEFVHSWYRYVKTEFEPYFRRDRFKDLAKSWLKGIRAVYAIPRPFCSFEELKNALEWVKTDKTCFYHKNVRSLANLAKKTWNSKNGDPELMLKKLLQEYSEHEKGETITPQKPSGPIDVPAEIPEMVKTVLGEEYDPYEDYFEQMCRLVSERVVSIWEALNKANMYQKPADKQDWIKNPKCLEKLAEVVRLWNKYGKGGRPDYDGLYGSWYKFWKKVDSWCEHEIAKSKPGVWVMDKLQNYFQE